MASWNMKKDYSELVLLSRTEFNNIWYMLSENKRIIVITPCDSFHARCQNLVTPA